MKKIFTLMAVAATTLSMSAADEVTKFFFGENVNDLKELSNGQTVEAPCEVIDDFFYTQSSQLWLGAMKNEDMDLTVTSDAKVSVCFWDSCGDAVPGVPFTKSFLMGDYGVQKSEGDYMIMDLQIHSANCNYSETKPTDDVTVTVEVYDYTTEAELSATVIMLASTENGIASVVLNKDEIKVTNNIMAYSVSKATKLSVYGITGRLAAMYSISGAGTISLNNLPKGVYIYTDGTHKGKFIIK